MKATMNRIITVLVLATAITASAGPQTISILRDWQFGTAANPASSGGPAGGTDGRAVIAPGEYSDGWFQAEPMYGPVVGIWDLGLRGTITLTDANLLGPLSSQHRERSG